jgi:hypothetical protein
MKSEFDLPVEVIAELEANRKVAAIKLLRTHQGIGLKEAKKVVDDYERVHPVDSGLQAPESDTGIGRILVLIIGVSLIYGLYRYFS